MTTLADRLSLEWGISYDETEGILRPFRGYIETEED